MTETPEVVAHYEAIREEERITQGLGTLELMRTLALLERHLPDPPASLVDVGGGTGVYATRLADAGYQVHLVDLTPRHVVIAQALPNVTAEQGDARRLSIASDTYDAGLLLGPLYHLTKQDDRVRALREIARVVRPGGVVAAAAISRFASLFDGLARGFLFDHEFQRIVENDLRDGQHRNDRQHPRWFTTAFFHHPDELRLEISAAQLDLIELVGVEGLAGWLPSLEAHWETEAGREVIMHAAEAVEKEPTLLGLSAHLLAIARVRE
jgi:SAM-dependent methyltransferase